MYFVIFTTDKPGMEQVRIDIRDAHRAYLRNHPDHPGVILHHGGPTLAEDGEAMIGSLMLIEAPSLEAVKAFAADDPYSKADLFAESYVRPWNWVTGRSG